MTREEEIKNFANNEYKDIGNETDYTSTAAYEGIIKGATWADNTMIAKACKWLNMNIMDYITEGSREGISPENQKQLIEDFRKAMLEEE